MSANFTVSTRIKGIDELSGPMKRIGASIESVSGRMKRAAASANGLRRAASGIGKALSPLRAIGRWGLALGGIGGLLGGLNLGVFAKVTTGWVERTRGLSIAAARVGMTAQGLKELRYAAEHADLPMETLDQSISRFSKNLGLMRAGRGPLSALLKVVAPDFAGQLKQAKNMDDAFMLIMRGIANTRDPAKRAALAAAAFGKEGVRMLDLLEEGYPAFEATRKAEQRFGLVSEDAGKKAKALDQALIDLKWAGTSLANRIGELLAPRFTQAANGIAEWIGKNREFIGQKVDAVIGNIYTGLSKIDWDAFGKNFAGAMDFISGKSTVLKNLPSLIELTGAAIGLSLIPKIGALITSLKSLGVWAAANPVAAGIIATAGVAAGTYYIARNWKDVTANMEGGFFSDFAMMINSGINSKYKAPGIPEAQRAANAINESIGAAPRAIANTAEPPLADANGIQFRNAFPALAVTQKGAQVSGEITVRVEAPEGMTATVDKSQWSGPVRVQADTGARAIGR